MEKIEVLDLKTFFEIKNLNLAIKLIVVINSANKFPLKRTVL